MSLTERLSKTLGNGCMKSTDLQTITCAKYLSEINVIQKIKGKSPRKKVKNQQNITAFPTQKHLPKAIFVLRKALLRWLAKSNRIQRIKDNSIRVKWDKPTGEDKDYNKRLIKTMRRRMGDKIRNIKTDAANDKYLSMIK